MNIVCTPLYEEQLKDILLIGINENFEGTKKFKMYLDTVIINIGTKIDKYTKSIYFDDENIKDIKFQGLRIPFLVDKENNTYLLLAIMEQ